MQVADNYFKDQDDGPPGILLLAVRAARRAVKENPEDARAHLLLGEAYLHLLSKSRERAWQRYFPSLTHVRQIQAAVALHRALKLQPGLIQAHYRLYELYRDMGYLDLASQQLRHVIRLAPAQGSDSSENRMNQKVKELDAEIRKRQDKFENQATQASVLERAIRALDNGLAAKALDILLASDVAVFGIQGTRMELDLLLIVGRIEEAREWMGSSLEAELGSDNYHRLRVKLEAADGNYQACDEELAQMAAALDRRVPREMIGSRLGQILLEAPWQKQSVAKLLVNRLQTTELLEHLKVFGADIRQQAEAEMLRGALALERGDVSRAESFLRRALNIGGDATERSAAQGMLDWLSHE
jgi:tetratricopeptide (TPR) repeat protein